MILHTFRSLFTVVDEACLAIVNFLEIGHTQSPSNGWQLFMAVDTLAAGSHSIIDCMSASYLPSTLVKCLYLFFDLPAVETGQGRGDLTPAESRLLLQKTFVQVRFNTGVTFDCLSLQFWIWGGGALLNGI